MARVKRGFKARRRRNKIMKLAKGFHGRKKSIFRRGREAVKRAGVQQYRDRKVKKRTFRQLWITRINAATRVHNLSYSQFIHKLSESGITLNRKVLAEMAVSDPTSFDLLVKKVQGVAAAA